MDFKVVTSVDEARKVWEIFSKNDVIDDNWDFRYTFFQRYQHALWFIVGFDRNEAIGLLPLQLSNRKEFRATYVTTEGEFLEFFGGDDTDNNEILLKPGYEECETLFLDQITKPAYLAPLRRKYTYPGISAEEYTKLYHLDLSTCKTLDDYFSMYWSKSSGSQLQKHIRKIYREHKVSVTYGNVSDLEHLFRLNEQRFQASSSLTDSVRRQIFYDLVRNFKSEIITLIIDGKVEAVSLGIHYNDRYIGLNAGSNYYFPNIGKLSMLLRIERAMELGCKIYDSGKGSSGWKEKFGFTGTPQYLLSLTQ